MEISRGLTDSRGGDGRSPHLATDDVRSRGEAQWQKSSQARPRPRIRFGDHLGRGGSGCGNCRGWGQGEHWEVSQHRQAGTQQQLDLSQRLKVNLKCHDDAYLSKSIHFVRSCPPKFFLALNKLIQLISQCSISQKHFNVSVTGQHGNYPNEEFFCRRITTSPEISSGLQLREEEEEALAEESKSKHDTYLRFGCVSP